MTFKVRIFKVSNTYFLVAAARMQHPQGFVYRVALTDLPITMGTEVFCQKLRVFICFDPSHCDSQCESQKIKIF